MAWTPTQVLAWLDEVEPRADGRSHLEWLELPPTAAPGAAQGAYHAIARTRHPDLFRRALSERELDRLTRMYARVSNAYAALRSADADARPALVAPAKPASIDPTRAMNARALVLYRRAEGALRTGDRAAARLNIKMAIAADPASALLRGALAELDADD
jgi:hypothetical protein